MFNNYNENELNEIIKNQIEEDLHLDYKSADSLNTTEKNKKEISKDISAFANSDGGVIIYGIQEFKHDTKHLPERIDPINRNEISKEKLEQIINSNIQPKINGVLIYPIQLSSDINHVVYVVKIPKSTTAHQASDKRYYKRHNFLSEAMADYEIKDIINRTTQPDLYIVFDDDEIRIADNTLNFPFFLTNSASKMADNLQVVIEINEPHNCDVIKSEYFSDTSNINLGRRTYISTNNNRVYGGQRMLIGWFSLRLKPNITYISFISTIYTDNTYPLINRFAIKITNGQPAYIVEDLHTS